MDKKKRIQSKQESYYRDIITKEKKEAKKGRRWMPRLSEAKKDVISCEKLRGLANTNRSVDIRMGEPGTSNVVSSIRENIAYEKKYLVN